MIIELAMQERVTTLSPQAARMLEYIEHNDTATFVELKGVYGEGADGDYEISVRPNVILWVGMSTDFLKALNALKDKVGMSSASYLSYVIDGGMLKLPIAKRPRDYKKPHWFPVCFRPMEKAEIPLPGFDVRV